MKNETIGAALGRSLRRVATCAGTGGQFALCASVTALALVPGLASAAPQTVLSEQIELARLVDLCATRLHLNIQYDANELKGNLTLRLGAGVSDDELWSLTNRLLASKGLTSIQMPGEETLSIVRLNEAASLARVEEAGLAGATAGYVKILQELEHRSAEQVLPALQLLTSKPGGAAVVLGRSNRLMLADRVPQLEQLLQILAIVDVPPGASVTEELQPEHVSPARLVKLVDQLVTTRATVLAEPLQGKLLALEGDRGLLLVAPLREEEAWRDMITLLDRPEGLTTVTYTPRSFGLAEVSKLIEEVVHGSGTATGDDWRMITDELTGALIITATPSEHARIVELIERLESAPLRDAVIEEIPVKNVDSARLIAIVEQVAKTRADVIGETLQGKLMPAPSGGGILVIAPGAEIEFWRDLIDRLDQVQSLTTVAYSPKAFSLREVADLVEEVAKRGPRGLGDGWRMVTDELTGTLIVTATPGQHELIVDLIERLELAAPTTRRPMRSFVIKNRSATDLVELLERLIGEGALGANVASAQSTESGVRQMSRDGAPVAPQLAGQEESEPRSRTSTPPVARGSATLDGHGFSLTADEATNTLIAIGDAPLLDQLASLIETVDVRQSQVMLEVLIAILTDSESADLGVELQSIGTTNGNLIALSSLFGLQSPPPGDPGAPAPVATGFSGLVLNQGDFSALVHALEVVNKGRVLTMPRVMVNNNEEAVLDSVDQTPFASTNASNTVATTSFGGTLDAGTTLTVTPQIAEGDHLVLRYDVSLSTFTGDAVDPALPPPRQQNSLRSVVTIPDGYTIALGGLEMRVETEATSKVPFLGDIPVLGALFRSRSTTTNRSRLFVFIRANIYRHGGFEDLRFMSEFEMEDAGVEDSWPEVAPRWIR